MSRYISLAALTTAVLAVPATAQRVQVELVTEKTSYVLHEPIKGTITITNVDASPIRVPPADMLGMDEMLFLYFEIEDAQGHTRRVKSVRHWVHRIGPNAGSILLPGGSIQLFCYPVLTNKRVNADGNTVGATSIFWTFPAPGTYILRAVYHVNAWDASLVELQDGRSESNSVTITIVAPNETEREILEVLWHCDPAGEDGIGLRRVDLPMLASLIAKYPDNPLTNHAEYALGRLLYARSIAEDPPSAEEAAKVLADLAESAGEFRHAEVRRTLAETYLRMGKQQEAATVLLPLLTSDPSLWTNWPFVITASKLTPDPNESQRAWRDREKRGKDKRIPAEQVQNVWSRE